MEIVNYNRETMGRSGSFSSGSYSNEAQQTICVCSSSIFPGMWTYNNVCKNNLKPRKKQLIAHNIARNTSINFNSRKEARGCQSTYYNYTELKLCPRTGDKNSHKYTTTLSMDRNHRYKNSLLSRTNGETVEFASMIQIQTLP